MPCERCGKQNPADVHTCTPCREYMLEIIQKEISDGNECMLGDILDRIHHHKRDSEYNNDMTMADFVNYIDSYQYGVVIRYIEARKPLSDQDYNCIYYIRSLLPPEVRK